MQTDCDYSMPTADCRLPVSDWQIDKMARGSWLSSLGSWNLGLGS